MNLKLLSGVLVVVLFVSLVTAGFLSRRDTTFTADKMKLSKIKEVTGVKNVILERTALKEDDNYYYIDKVYQEGVGTLSSFKIEKSGLTEEQAIEIITSEAIDGFYKIALWRESHIEDKKDEGGKNIKK